MRASAGLGSGALWRVQHRMANQLAASVSASDPGDAVEPRLRPTRALPEGDAGCSATP